DGHRYCSRRQDQSLQAARARGGGRRDRHRARQEAGGPTGARRRAEPCPAQEGFRSLQRQARAARRLLLRSTARGRVEAMGWVAGHSGLMGVLLDTHALIWWIEGDHRITARLQQLLGRPEEDVFVSAATAWEIATKVR